MFRYIAILYLNIYILKLKKKLKKLVQSRQNNIAIFECVIKFNKYIIMGRSLFYISIFIFKNFKKI
jgi:hypothetical protein